MRDRIEVAVVGAGAAGLVAAISSARRGVSVTVVERLPWIGKKLLASGGGRCNLLNDRLSASAYTSSAPGLVVSILDRFGQAEIRTFFGELGLRLQSDAEGRVYPLTNQAASVLKVLEREVGRLGIGLIKPFEVDRIERAGGRFRVSAADGRALESRTVILAGGGQSYPALGANGSGCGLAASLGHAIIPPVPSAVPLVVRDRMCHFLQGQRLRVRAEGRIGGRAVRAAEGEILFTQYGLSGTAVLDVSESLSIALNRDGRRDVSIAVDFLPTVTVGELSGELARRLKAGRTPADLTSGWLPEKFSPVLARMVGEAGDVRDPENIAEAARRLAARLKSWEYRVEATRGWNEAEFTSGGVDAREVKPGTLESKLRPGLYFAGEVLDVQGGRGGFNLAWAWASGFVAGLAE